MTDFRSEKLRMMRDLAKKLNEDYANWLDDIVAGLLINGVLPHEIEVVEYRAAGKTCIRVRGVERYEWKAVFVDGPDRIDP